MTIAVAAAAYLTLKGPDMRELRSLRIEATPQRLERGEYLARHVLVCVHCHTERDHDKFDLPATGPEFAGGECLGEEVNFPGTVCAPNITTDVEYGIGTWTDDEILRAIREGVSRDGRALFPMMPYAAYRNLSDEDAYAVVAYLKSLPPVATSHPATNIKFPVKFFIGRLPKPLEEPVTAPPPTEQVRYGEYLATVASCKGCHGESLAGGAEYPTLQGVVRPSNLTPDETGLTPAALDDFERMFRKFAPENAANADVEAGTFTIMPWASYAGMNDQDLAAIHAFLRGLPPVHNQVQTYGSAEK